MVTKTATRPTPRSSHSHSHSSSASHPQPHRTASRTSSSPLSPLSRASGQQVQPSSATIRSSGGAPTDVRTTSPNYFGLLVDPDPREAAIAPKHQWSSSSSILSFGAASPKHLPLESNPEFEAFRRQTEEGKGFNLGHGNLQHFASSPGTRLDRKPAKSDARERPPSSKGRQNAARDGTADGVEGDGRPSPGRTASGKLKSTLDKSMATSSFFDLPRQESPPVMASPGSMSPRNMLSHIDDRHPRLSLPQNRADPPSPHGRPHNVGAHRADTLPALLEEGPTMMPPCELRDIVQQLPSSEFLLLDLRVSPQFSNSRVKGALNLCIPTTLLKRPSFNLQKLQDTFGSDFEKETFSKWKTAKYIVVYDAYSSEKRDAVSAINTLNKFSSEGWKGRSYILRGGFREFSKTYPQLIDSRSAKQSPSSKISLSLGISPPDVAPVAGGCEIPVTKNPSNPFFSNIRQNQDLVDGVGQMDVKLPQSLGENLERFLPKWLYKASAQEDHGKRISNKFLRLELAEQARMTKALSGGVSYGTISPGSQDVQIAGVEKGGKNRYNNIWPFEHARVKLQGGGTCDYVNASHIKASRSNKRYIASQGPLPATFDDFWGVVWDQDVRVIVMLTAEKEGGQQKCHSYWLGREYGQLRLNSLSERKVSLDPTKRRLSEGRQDMSRKRANTTTEGAAAAAPPSDIPYAVVRKFTLSHSDHPFSPMREITQVHYSSWPDFGAPANANQLLSLVELSNLMQRAAASPTQAPRLDDPELAPSPRPMLVHCSAGCGRTGTFCAIDSVIDMLKRQRKELTSGVTPMEITSSDGGDDYIGKGKQIPGDNDWIFNQDGDLIEQTVEDFRGQRLSMVQSLRQYVLCYEAVIEWVALQHFGHNSSGGRERSGSDSARFERRNSNS